MFDRFTDRAKKVMSLSRQEALRLQHGHIAPEHMLLGLVAEGSGVAANVLKELSVEFAAVRREVEKLVERGPAEITAGQLPFTADGKRVLERALEEASELGHGYIGTEHLLLGLTRERDSVAGRVLARLGVRLDAARKEVLLFVGERGDADRKPIRSDAVARAQRYRTLVTLLAARPVPGSAYVVLPPPPGAGGDGRPDDRAWLLYRDVVQPALRDAGAKEVACSRDPAGAVPPAERLLRAAVPVVVAIDRDPDVLFALGFALGRLAQPIVLAANPADLPPPAQSAAVLQVAFDAAGLAALREQLTAIARERFERPRGAGDAGS